MLNKQIILTGWLVASVLISCDCFKKNIDSGLLPIEKEAKKLMDKLFNALGLNDEQKKDAQEKIIKEVSSWKDIEAELEKLQKTREAVAKSQPSLNLLSVNMLINKFAPTGVTIGNLKKEVSPAAFMDVYIALVKNFQEQINSNGKIKQV